MSLYVQETYCDRTRNLILGDSGVQEAFTDQRGELFRSCQAEYGRCTGKVMIDKEDGSTVAIGWVFERRVPYSDSPGESYLQEVWITLHAAPPVTITHHEYAELPVTV